jgi:hypothetical protein
MKSSTTTEFWECYSRLPPKIKQLARRTYKTWIADPRHKSLHFKKTGSVWSIRIGLHYRALGLAKEDGIEWFWIGAHDEYDKILRAGIVQ